MSLYACPFFHISIKKLLKTIMLGQTERNLTRRDSAECWLEGRKTGFLKGRAHKIRALKRCGIMTYNVFINFCSTQSPHIYPY
jgi:hypothetical protein